LTVQRRQRELQLEQARYEARLAQRQYDAVDPDNRLVASELERRWNEKLERGLTVIRLHRGPEKWAISLGTDLDRESFPTTADTGNPG